jgi:mycobactin peptide synthetase MbtF
MATLLGARDQQILLTQWRALPEILNDSDLTAMQALWDEALQETLT